MTEINSNLPLQKIQRLGNNTYYYNYITEVTQTITEDNKAVPVYKYIQVHLSGQPNYKQIVQAVLREYISQNEEFDLINSYNSYQNNLTTDDTVVSKYVDYLKLVQEIKTNIKKDVDKSIVYIGCFSISSMQVQIIVFKLVR